MSALNYVFWFIGILVSALVVSVEVYLGVKILYYLDELEDTKEISIAFFIATEVFIICFFASIDIFSLIVILENVADNAA
jgi:hypothetical protein